MEAVLRGITWGHSRGVTPLLAAAQRYEELHPGIQIQWKKRTLQEFADYPIEKLTEHYDLLIIDHPWVGCAAATNCVLPLDEYLPAAYLKNQLGNSVGGSFESYNYNNKQWALAIDAAAPFASYRKDLLSANNVAQPQTWEEVIDLARLGKVAVPAIPIDLLMNFYSFCIAEGEEPFLNSYVVSEEVGVKAMETMKDLYSLVDKKMFTCNPIAVAEMMSSTNDYWYCPFAYGYSNYSRIGFAHHLLHYNDVVSIYKKKLRTTIGGTGISVSAFSKYKEQAVDFAAFVCSEVHQKTVYVQHGGQPGHLAAWLNEESNLLTHDYFRQTLPVMQNGYMRPRYDGYLHFQDHAGQPLHEYLSGKTSAKDALTTMNEIYNQSLRYSKIEQPA
ncbi:MAG: extracellular solute-binding protein [Chitinophagaceae bacterium]|nr:extracellular solute-binding protein [Chitinophagaceae bacterium]